MLTRKIIFLLTCFFSISVFAAPSPHGASGPFDLAIANEDKLISMLKKSGKISAQATRAEAEAALYSILKQRQQNAALYGEDMSESPLFAGSAIKQSSRAAVYSKNGAGASSAYSAPQPVQPETYQGESRVAKLLTILVEFPDYPHNAITSDDTEFYFTDYNLEHYQALLFNEQTFAGPNGEPLISMNGYYMSQSGESYGVTGQVAGWYMVSQNAAFYGANDPLTGNDTAPRQLVMEALLAAQADPNIDLTQFDIEDRYDLDGDGDYWEADGLVDHVQIIHSAVGEEAGGGSLGEDAIWSHRWSLSGVMPLSDTPATVSYWGGVMAAFDYTMQPIDAAAGVICHEYGHDLNLPDEYDTRYSGRGEPVSYWSLMASGSWTGKIAGTQPSGFSPFARQFLQESLGGNWLTGERISVLDLDEKGKLVAIDEAATKGTNNDVVRVDLPDKETVVVEPASGDYLYFSGSGDNLFNYMFTAVDLSEVSSASLHFKTSFDIETDWDYAYVAINGEFVAGNITTNFDPYGQNYGNGITGQSGGWVDAEFDISAFVGEFVTIEFYYITDAYVSNPGIYIDDVSLVLDGSAVFVGGGETEPDAFLFGGFSKDRGIMYTPQYYLLEWRTHTGIDEGLKYIPVAGEHMSSNQGLLLWFVDDYYTDNWVGMHPGYGFLGVVDADQKALVWSDGYVASTRYQISDAAFSMNESGPLSISLNDPEAGLISLFDYYTDPVRAFVDTRDYSSPELPDAGRVLPSFGFKAKVRYQSADGSVGKIKIYRHESEN